MVCRRWHPEGVRGTVRFKEMVTFTDIYSTHGRMATIRCDYSCKRICIKFSSLTRISYPELHIIQRHVHACIRLKHWPKA